MCDEDFGYQREQNSKRGWDIFRLPWLAENPDWLADKFKI
jgi:hypothetical protein